MPRLPKRVWLCRGCVLHRVGDAWSRDLLAYTDARAFYGCDGPLRRLAPECKRCKGPVAYVRES
jgi:hypothetical protein